MESNWGLPLSAQVGIPKEKTEEAISEEMALVSAKFSKVKR